MAVPDGRLAEAMAVLDNPEHTGLGEHLLGQFGRTGNALLRAALVPILVERQRLSPDQLDRLLDNDDDALAAAAAEGLAWVGGREQAGRLLQQAGGARSPFRLHTCLFAAVALGSSAALEEVRRRLHAGE